MVHLIWYRLRTYSIFFANDGYLQEIFFSHFRFDFKAANGAIHASAPRLNRLWGNLGAKKRANLFHYSIVCNDELFQILCFSYSLIPVCSSVEFHIAPTWIVLVDTYNYIISSFMYQLTDSSDVSVLSLACRSKMPLIYVLYVYKCAYCRYIWCSVRRFALFWKNCALVLRGFLFYVCHPLLLLLILLFMR